MGVFLYICNMTKIYFDPDRTSHLELLKYLEEELSDSNSISMYKLGHRTQHIFIEDKYLMTIDWTKV